MFFIEVLSPGHTVIAEPTDFTQRVFLAAYDPEAYEGRGSATFTYEKSEALMFETQKDAMELWRTIPECRPKREDDKPNRPLTTFSIAIEKYEEVFHG